MRHFRWFSLVMLLVAPLALVAEAQVSPDSCTQNVGRCPGQWTKGLSGNPCECRCANGETATGYPLACAQDVVTPNPPATPPAKPGGNQFYGAIAVAIWTGSNGSQNVATGVSWNHNSQLAADNDALTRCRGQGGQDCSVRTRFWNGGCGWVSIAQDGAGNCAGWAGTQAEALKQCTSRGCACRPAIGGCTSPAN